MRDLPISNYARKYYEEKGRTFTDSEKATVFWNSFLPRDERTAVIKEIADTTSDVELKKQIMERLEYEKEAEAVFRTPEPYCIYIFATDDSSKWNSEGYFAEVEPAIEHGKRNCTKRFTITKYRLEDKCGDDDTCYLSKYYFSKDGEVIDYDETLEYVCRFEKDSGRFENQFLMLDDPFRKGDIVYFWGNDRPGVVQLGEGNAPFLENVKNGTLCFTPEFWDMQNNVSFLWEDGELSHGHPNYLFLEKIDHWDDRYEWDVLTNVSALMKGEGEMDCFFTAYDVNIENKKSKGGRKR